MIKTLVVLGAMAAAGVAFADVQQAGKSPARSIYDFIVKDIQGKEVALSKYRGDVFLVINVASK